MIKVIEELLDLIDKYADPYEALLRKVEVKDELIIIDNYSFKIGRKPLVISIGKCAYKMAKWSAEKIRMEKGIMIRPINDVQGKIDNFLEIRSTHPQPSYKSLEAAKLIEEEITKDYSSIIFMISGGSSALVEDPLIDIEDFIIVNDLLLKSGANIQEINIVRKHLSRIKGGKLAKLCKSKFITIAVSDVAFDDPSTIGSGITYPDSSTYEDAYRVLLSKKIWDKIPEKVKEVIKKGTIGEIEETPKKFESPYFIVLRNRDVLEAIANKLKSYNPLILTSWAQGESREIAKLFARIFYENRENNALIMGGELDVTVKGKGKGGRNTEFILSFLKNMPKENYHVLAYATDGIDGNSEAAGAWADENTLEEIKSKGIELEKEIEENNTGYVLDAVGKLIKRGITGNNVNNVYLAWRD